MFSTPMVEVPNAAASGADTRNVALDSARYSSVFPDLAHHGDEYQLAG